MGINKIKNTTYTFLGIIGLIATYLIFNGTDKSGKNLETLSESAIVKKHNSELIDSNLKFLVLDSVIVELFDGYAWQGKDIEEPNAKGSIFYAYDNPPSISVASITVVDVSEDVTEPDISLMRQEDVEHIDNQFRKAVSSGMNLTKWMSSQLNENKNHKGLVTAYITTENEKEWQYIALRLSNNGRKIVIIGSFDISKKDELASLVFNTISYITFKN